MSRYFSPQNGDDWEDMIARMRETGPSQLTAEEFDDLSTSDQDAYCEQCAGWNRRLGPFRTPESDEVEKLLSRTIASNEAALLGGRRIGVINGPPTTGKSSALVLAILRDTHRVWSKVGRKVDGAVVMPYVYIEIQPLMKPKSITQSICRFLQVPYLPRESTEELTGRLQQLLPKMQTKAICIDDAHQVRAGKESSYVTDWFKHAVTALPTSFIFTGADMESSALLSSRASGGYVASDQIARRAERVTFARRPLTFDAKAPWTKDLRLVESTVRLPTGSSVGHMSSRAASEWLHNETGGYFGALVDLARDLAAAALTESLSLAAVIRLRSGKAA